MGHPDDSLERYEWLVLAIAAAIVLLIFCTGCRTVEAVVANPVCIWELLEALLLDIIGLFTPL